MTNLVLPDRMSVIIGEGIKIEPVYETTAGGEEIYVGKASIDPAYMDILNSLRV